MAFRNCTVTGCPIFSLSPTQAAWQSRWLRRTQISRATATLRKSWTTTSPAFHEPPWHSSTQSTPKTQRIFFEIWIWPDVYWFHLLLMSIGVFRSQPSKVFADITDMPWVCPFLPVTNTWQTINHYVWTRPLVQTIIIHCYDRIGPTDSTDIPYINIYTLEESSLRPGNKALHGRAGFYQLSPKLDRFMSAAPAAKSTPQRCGAKGVWGPSRQAWPSTSTKCCTWHVMTVMTPFCLAIWAMCVSEHAHMARSWGGKQASK